MLDTVCMYVRAYICVCECVCVYACVHAHWNDTAFLLEATDGLELQVLDTVCVYMYVCMYVCMCVFMQIASVV